VEKVINMLNAAWIYMSMTNYPYPTTFLSPMPGWPVTESCKPYADIYKMELIEKTKVESLLTGEEAVGWSDRELALLRATRASVGIYYNYTGQAPCFDLEADETPDLDADGWYVMECNEMCMPMAPNGKTDMFLPQEWDEAAHEKMCEEKWGLKPQWDWPLTYFGGKDLKHDFMH
jgi:lysosomal Pro-X carboxypeptidase